jgi:hypothetical protein
LLGKVAPLTLEPVRSSQRACQNREQVASDDIGGRSDYPQARPSEDELARTRYVAAAAVASAERSPEQSGKPLLDVLPVSEQPPPRRKPARWEPEELPDPEAPGELPRYIRGCSNNPDPNKPLIYFYTWEKDEPGRVARAPYKCKSWRCPYGCAEHESHVLYMRLEEAFANAPASELVFMVLSCDSHVHELARIGGSAALRGIYKQMGQRAMYFRRRLRRIVEKLGIPWFDNQWVRVLEMHSSGVPHLNFIIRCPELARFFEDRRRQRRRDGRSKNTARLLASIDGFRDDIDREIYEALTECGFGYRSTAEVPHDRHRVISYINKVAKRADKTAGEFTRHVRAERGARRRRRVVGEVAKASQLPTRAPKGTRRVASGIKFIPPRHKGTKTGTVVMRFTTAEGDEIVRPLVKTKDPVAAAMTAICLDIEQREAWKDEDKRVLQHKLAGALVDEAEALGKIHLTPRELSHERRARARLVGAYKQSLRTQDRPRSEQTTIYRIAIETLEACGVVAPRAGPGPAGIGPPPEPELSPRDGPTNGPPTGPVQLQMAVGTDVG